MTSAKAEATNILERRTSFDGLHGPIWARRRMPTRKLSAKEKANLAQQKKLAKKHHAKHAPVLPSRDDGAEVDVEMGAVDGRRERSGRGERGGRGERARGNGVAAEEGEVDGDDEDEASSLARSSRGGARGGRGGGGGGGDGGGGGGGRKRRELSATEKKAKQDFWNAPLMRDEVRGENNHSRIFSHLCLFVNVGMFAYCMFLVDWHFETLSVNPLIGPSSSVFVTVGAKVTQKIVQGKQYERLLFACFLHGGLIHLGFNMSAFWHIGGDMEREHGWWRVGLIYLVSGVAGMALVRLRSRLRSLRVPSLLPPLRRPGRRSCPADLLSLSPSLLSPAVRAAGPAARRRGRERRDLRHLRRALV